MTPQIKYKEKAFANGVWVGTTYTSLLQDPLANLCMTSSCICGTAILTFWNTPLCSPLSPACSVAPRSCKPLSQLYISRFLTCSASRALATMIPTLSDSVQAYPKALKALDLLLWLGLHFCAIVKHFEGLGTFYNLRRMFQYFRNFWPVCTCRICCE